MPLRTQNHLIGDLPADDRSALLIASQPWAFDVGHVFCEPGDHAAFVDFIETGVISAVAVMADGRTVETFMIGREGATHPLAYDASPRCYSRLVAQLAGSARRIEAARLRDLAAERPAIGKAMADYAMRLTHELEQSTACNALHSAEERFAKWLLRCHDRVEGDELRLTQEFLASMLGAQRTTVNEAAQDLKRRGAVDYMRGKITVTDRVALEGAACECYGVHCRTMDELADGHRSPEQAAR